MDDVELKAWIELRKIVKSELLEIKYAFSKAQAEQDMLENLHARLVQMENERLLNPISKEFVKKWFISDSEKNATILNDEDKKFQLQRVRRIYLEEKLKIIENKIGQDTVKKIGEYEIESILKFENE
jgi:hypothetical protein